MSTQCTQHPPLSSISGFSHGGSLWPGSGLSGRAFPMPLRAGGSGATVAGAEATLSPRPTGSASFLLPPLSVPLRGLCSATTRGAFPSGCWAINHPNRLKNTAVTTALHGDQGSPVDGVTGTRGSASPSSRLAPVRAQGAGGLPPSPRSPSSLSYWGRVVCRSPPLVASYLTGGQSRPSDCRLLLRAPASAERACANTDQSGLNLAAHSRFRSSTRTPVHRR